MSAFVFMLGALLSLGGAASIYSGYGLVEVGRASTAVIAGTTALSAGVTTIGIAFVLRCLVRLQAFLETERGFLPLLNELALDKARLRDPRPVVPAIEAAERTASVDPDAGAPNTRSTARTPHSARSS